MVRRKGIFRLDIVLLLLFALSSALAQADVGTTQIAGKDGDGPVTIFYPSSSKAQPITRGPFKLDLAVGGTPVTGNGRLVVFSHGSGGSPWEYTDLARTMVDSGFVVAVPEHRGDNYRDMSGPGPESWKRRPTEVSRAIDAVGQDVRIASTLRLDKVGAYGISAGGHTMLSLAGGRWSPARLAQHCEAHIADDFQACVGLMTHLRGNVFDGMKKAIARWVIRYRADDATWYTYSEPRIAAVVAGVPYAADFDMASLASPRIPLALVTAQQDKWLVPRFHSEAVLRSCTTCERLADFPTGGHGALLSPLPPELTGLLGDLLNDPPGFDRVAVPDVNRKITVYFQKQLLP